MKTRIAAATDGDRFLIFWCPGCDQPHGPRVEGPDDPDPAKRKPKWTWNGDRARPTLQPSILVHTDGRDGTKKCHSYVTDGQIQFLGDSYHSLAGQTVPIPEWPKEDWGGLTED